MSTENLEQSSQQQEPKAARSYNPFISPVNEKPYSQMNVNVEQQRMYSPIPEAALSGNVVDGNENAYNMLNGDMGSFGGGSSANGGSIGGGFNSSMNELPDKDKKAAAEQLAKMLVDAYGFAKQSVNGFVQISDKTVKNLEAEGEISLTAKVPLSDGVTITAREFIQDYNEQNKDVFKLSKEFRKEIMPPLTRILEKRGAGLTDEQMVIYIIGKDAAITGFQAYQLKKNSNDVLDMIRERTAEEREARGSFTTNAPTTPKPTPPPPPPPPVNTDDFNFRTNETVMDSTVQKHVVPENGKARLMAQKKREKEIEEAMKRAEKLQNPNAVSYAEAMASKKTGKRGRKPKDYVKAIDEAEIADAIILSETKNSESEFNED